MSTKYYKNDEASINTLTALEGQSEAEILDQLNMLRQRLGEIIVHYVRRKGERGVYRAGCVVGAVINGVPHVGWSACREEDVKKKWDWQTGEVLYHGYSRERALLYAISRLRPVADYIGNDKSALCTQAPRRLTNKIAEVSGLITSQWARNFKSC